MSDPVIEKVTDPATEPWGSFVRLTDPEGPELLVRSTVGSSSAAR